MAATNFQTANSTFRRLVAGGLSYRVPRFQRDYSWEENEWEDLWSDILGAIQSERGSAHYMGYLVLQSGDDRTFDVIDGQQRLTTISVLILAILKNIQRLIEQGIEPDINKRRLEQMQITYIGYIDPVTMLAQPKLTLNRNNNQYFQNYLVPLGPLPKRNFRASEHLLRKAFEWFDRQVQIYQKNDRTQDGSRLAQLAEDISDTLFFTVITVTDELNAYRVFETLNSRGVRLSSTDLLKNYLFSVLDRGASSHHEIAALEERWETIVTRLQSEKFPDFLRVHWNSRHTFTRQTELFKTIRADMTTPEAIFRLLRDMEEDVDSYLALTSPEPSDWPSRTKTYATNLRTFRVRQPFPLLLAARRVLQPADFTDLLRAIVVISLRYNVICSLSTGEQERTYSDVARRIAKGDLTRLGPILTALRGIYPDDAVFKAAFGAKAIRTADTRNNRVVKFILSEIEHHISGLDIDIGSDTLTLEHILPQSAPDGWGGMSHADAEAMVFRLGNMVLLDGKQNRTLSAQDYGTKREVFHASQFSITRRVAEHNRDWTPERIQVHQSWLADQAAALWQIPQLSPDLRVPPPPPQPTRP